MVIRFLIALAFALSAAAGEKVGSAEGRAHSFFQNITTEDGLSQVSVLSIYQDHRGYMWFGTRSGLNRFDGVSVKAFITDPQDTLSLSNGFVRSIAEDLDGNLWVGTLDGLNRYNPSDGSFSRYFLAPRSGRNANVIRAMSLDKNSGALYVAGGHSLGRVERESDGITALPWSGGRINTMVLYNSRLLVGASDGLHIMDLETLSDAVACPFDGITDTKAVDYLIVTKSQEIWAASTREGLVARIEPSGNRLELYDFHKGKAVRTGEIRTMAEDHDGTILIGTDSGMFFVDRSLGRILRFEGGDIHCTIESIFLDSIESLWVGTYSEGVFHSNDYGTDFIFHDTPTELSFPSGAIGPMAASGSTVWIGTEGGGLVSFDSASGLYRRFPCVRNSQAPFRDNNVKCLLKDGSLLYAGLYSGWVYVMDTESGRYVAKYHNPDGRPVTALEKDGEGKILVGTFSEKPVKILSPDGTLVPLEFDGAGQIRDITVLRQCSSGLYIGTKRYGAYRLTDGHVERIDLSSPESGTGYMVSAIMEDSRGTVFLGTTDAGVFQINPDSLRASAFRLAGLSGQSTVRTLLVNPNGGVWVVTKRSISLVSDAGVIVNSYSPRGWRNIHEFSERSICLSDRGVAYVGGNNGFISFIPANMRENGNIPPVVIDAVYVNNKPLRLDFENPPVIRLKSTNNNITISYRALNYIYPEQNKYMCRMSRGKDVSWSDMGSLTTANYQDLKPGNYHFTVKGSNNNGIWNEVGADLAIKIRKPFYASVPAIILYIALLVFIMVLIMRTDAARVELEKEAFLKDQEHRFYQERINLFTNFSHELRTPLALIKAPVDEAVSHSVPISLSSTKMIQRNVNRIMLLVDQIMLFRKEESGTLKPSVSPGDFVGFAREMKVAFGEVARSRCINLMIEEGTVPEDIWYDRALFERVFMNLLSNAFKYTPDGGSVKISLGSLTPDKLASEVPDIHGSKLYREAGDYLKITIQDTGPGVKAEDKDKIFDPFFQSKGSKGGAGIGLTLSSLIIGLHHGAIWVDNSPGGGAVFSMVIPSGCAHFAKDELNLDYKDSESISRYEDEDTVAAEKESAGTELLPGCSVLVVEDNKDLLDYIADRLKSHFKVFKASNGREGLIMAKSQMPTIILSDIMMPVMDGLMMCREIKEASSLNHIPVILLTARSYALQMKEGLEFGADDYITKPFSIDELIMKLSNIIKSRENLKKLYARDLSLENMGVELRSDDERFLQKLNTIISASISDPEFDVESLCQKIGMSRPSLYRRMQSAAQMSPSRFIQTVRLHLAAKMLRETDLSLLEIMDATGFSNPTHFTSLFKTRYGLPPMAFRKENLSPEGSLSKPY